MSVGNQLEFQAERSRPVSRFNQATREPPNRWELAESDLKVLYVPWMWS